MKNRWRITRILLLFACLMLADCGPTRVYAPIQDAPGIEKVPVKGMHRVRRGETIYSIAWRYGLDFRMLVALNHLHKPWRLKTGRHLRLRPEPHHPVILTKRKKGAVPLVILEPPFADEPLPPEEEKEETPLQAVASAPHFVASTAGWNWPAAGELATGYSRSNRGINIAGHEGAPVYASASGQVVYSGNGLRGYGNLILLQHSGRWLSAYAWNHTVGVRQGEWVRAGQQIATMGVHRKHAMLHFEIRKDGRPVNPSHYLQEKNSLG